ncbi:hypothetical protein C8R44DRAFT_31012 [Mycena epipterygia]|nr:hypothetical protein C8R44DRAFT_31012 [Mycena epipterygia]
MYQSISDSQKSSNSFSLLPAQPKIFHGRQAELKDITTNLTQKFSHIAILGAGGIGKTSLARTALHHPHVAAKYEHRFFIAADSTTTSVELAALAGSHLGLKPGKDLTKAVVQFLSRGPPCLLVLDNLETPWEPLESRAGIEEFLSLLTDIPHVALIITMQGAERPAKVNWTRPFLEPLKPLSYDASRQTFIEIADDFHNSKDIDRLLSLTDNMPLAVDLIAHLVDYEGCSNVLACWEIEKTSVISTGYDKQSSLDASIMISLGSPRMTSGAKDLLSLLSILPDGLSDVELFQCDFPIQDLLTCRAVLLRTSLAYFDDGKRLKSLVPIREHMHTFSPPSPQLSHPLCKYFHLVMELYEKYRGVHQNNTRIDQITSNLGNLHELLLNELHADNPDLTDAITCTFSLNSFQRMTGHARTVLMDHIPAVLPQPCDHYIEVKYVIEEFSSIFFHPIVDPQHLIEQGTTHFHHLNDPVLESRFYRALGAYYKHYKNDMSASMQCLEKASSLAKFCGDSGQQCLGLEAIARLEYSIADYPAALLHAREAQEIAQLSANLYREALALEIEAGCLTALGNLRETVLRCQKARELLQLCGMEGGYGDYVVIVNLAQVHLLKSEYLEARSIHSELVQKASAKQDPFYTAFSLLNIAEVDIMIGADILEVQRNLDSAKTIFSSLGLLVQMNQCEMYLADLNLRKGNAISAKKLLQQCLMTAWKTDPEAVSHCLERLADFGHWTSTNINCSYQWAVIYLVQAHKTQETLALHKALRFMGDIFLAEGDQETACNLFVVALDGFTYMDVHRSRADCMLRLGDIAQYRGDLVKAAELWKEAHPLFERSSQAKDIAQIDTRLALIDQDMSDTHLKKIADLSLLDAPTKSLDALFIMQGMGSG